jgi:hypothetical protein
MAASATLKTGNEDTAMKSVTSMGRRGQPIDHVGHSPTDQQSETDRRRATIRVQPDDDHDYATTTVTIVVTRARTWSIGERDATVVLQS